MVRIAMRFAANDIVGANISLVVLLVLYTLCPVLKSYPGNFSMLLSKSTEINNYMVVVVVFELD